MKKKILRFLEIALGVLLIIAGVIMLFTPGQGTLAIIAGIFLISPQHGRRVIWWLKQLWKKVKSWWYSWRFKRTMKHKIWLKARKKLRRLGRQ